MTPDTVRAFAAAVFEPSFSAGFHAVLVGIRGQRPDAEIRPKRCKSVDEMITGVEQLADGGFNIYYPTALIRADHVLPPGSRGTELDAVAILGFHVDLDLKGAAHPDATLPDIPTALRVIDAFEVPPSFVVATGHGVQAFWLFKEPLSISSDDDRRRTKLLIRRFVATIAAIARQQGGHHVDGTGDLARVLRMPGTLNLAHRNGKALPVVPARLLRPEGALDEMPHYNPSDLEPLLVDVSDDEAVDHTLVGAFELKLRAAAPAIVERLSIESEAFRRLWIRDAKAEVHDKSTSGYRYAMIGALVVAGATDQDIADAVCAWYAAHEPAYDKHIRRPALVAHEIAKQRSRARAGRAQQSRAELPARSVPTVVGPCGVTLVPSNLNRTNTRWNVAFEVHVSGVDTGMELKGTDTSGGVDKAVHQMKAVLRAARRDGAPTDHEVEQLDAWLRTLLTNRKLEAVESEFAAYRDSIKAVAAAPNQPSMFDIALQFFLEEVGLAFVEPKGDLWSEKQGRAFTKSEVLSHLDPRLRAQVARASDCPRPTPNDPTKVLRHLQQELKSVYVALRDHLPDEVHCDTLGPDSKAAQRFRREVIRLWRAPETWMKQQGGAGEMGHVALMSLASRVRDLVEYASRETPRWNRVHKAAEAYYRVERGKSGRRNVWLAMRSDLCGTVRGVRFDAVRTQGDLTALMTRYGLADAEGVTNRIREDKTRSRLCVLSRELCDELLEEIDPNEAAGPPESSPDGPPDYVEVDARRDAHGRAAR